MIERILYSLTVLVSFASIAHAQPVTLEEDSLKDFLFIGGERSFACYSQEVSNQLGTLSRKKLESGAVFRSFNASKEMLSKERSLNTLLKKQKQSKSKSQRAKFKARITELKKSLDALELASSVCKNFKPEESDANADLPPTLDPNNPPVHLQPNNELPPRDQSPGGDVNPTPIAPAPTPVAPTPTQSPTPEPQIPAIQLPTVFSAHSFTGSVSVPGISNGIEVTLSNSKFALSAPVADGIFKFSNVPVGDYLLSVRASGLNFGHPRSVKIQDVAPIQSQSVRFTASDVLSSNEFYYHWEAVNSVSAGYEYSSNVLTLPTIKFLEEEVLPADTTATARLFEKYKVILSNENLVWDSEVADRLFKTFETLPIFQPEAVKVSKWILDSSELADDILILDSGEGQTVILSKSAIQYATPKLVEINGQAGRYFSKRLHKAVVRFVTNQGKSWSAVQAILLNRFGVSMQVPNYTELTRYTTGETYTSFMDFKPEERVALINMFEEMPEGYHKAPGLNYVVRRRDGLDHPISPEAAAVAWVTVGYIEFMEKAFLGSQIDGTHRLVIHEKSHFLWEHAFDQKLRDDWATVGEWFVDNQGFWQTNQTTQFVTAYAHAKNPNEDMAESLAYFILNPEWLESRAPLKFAFIRDRVMKGDRYISTIREDLTFRVYNLNPDYIYPGKIKRLDIGVVGAPDENKTVTLEVELHSSGSGNGEGAALGSTRIFAPNNKAYTDVWLYPVSPDANGLSNILRGTFTVDKLSQHGFWNAYQIALHDSVGNSRYQGPTTFGWKMFINNPGEDLIAPKYVANSMRLSLEQRIVQGNSVVDAVVATWQVDENIKMRVHAPVNARLSNRFAPQGSMFSWGTFNDATQTAQSVFLINPHRPSGTYSLVQADMYDQALNATSKVFYEPAGPGQEESQKINYVSNDPDTSPADLDLNRITINGVPTNPQAPNGETLVTVRFYANDDISGINTLGLALRDPNGGRHHAHVNHSNKFNVLFDGDPTEYKLYEQQIILPVGSAPGIWGLSDIYTKDMAGNEKTFNFIETMHFQVAQ